MKKTILNLDPISLFSHELKTPLSSLQIALSLLSSDITKHKDLFPLMQEEVRKMSDFITDTLDLRYIQNNKKMFQFEWQEFAPALLKACSSFKLLAKKHKISINLKPTTHKKFEVFMDAKWMNQVLENLISNALQVTAKSGTICIEYGLQNQGSFYCLVKDQGPGLKNKNKIFQAFYTSSIKSKIGLKNQGLGLSIAKACIQAHKGSLQAYNCKNTTTGSCFKFSLPKARLLQQAA